MLLPAMLGPVMGLLVLTAWRGSPPRSRAPVMGVGALSPALQLPLFALGAASHRILLLVPRPALRRVIAAHRPRLGVRRALNLGGRLRPTVVDRRRGLLRLPTDLWLAVPGCG